MASQQLKGAGLALLVIAFLYFIVRSFGAKAVESLDNATKEATKPAGTWLSDLQAWWNGHQKVELTPLVIQEHHLNWDYTLTKEAEKVFWGIGEYHPVLYTVFGAKGRPMKAKYHHLIGRPLTEDVL